LIQKNEIISNLLTPSLGYHHAGTEVQYAKNIMEYGKFIMILTYSNAYL
jgi:hypothetical protein